MKRFLRACGMFLAGMLCGARCRRECGGCPGCAWRLWCAAQEALAVESVAGSV